MVQTGFEPRSPAWLLATLSIEPRKHSTDVVYCTYLTHFRTLQLYGINNVTLYTFIYDVWFVKVRPYVLLKRPEQRAIDTAVRQWHTRLRACVKAKGGHFKHKLSQ